MTIDLTLLGNAASSFSDHIQQYCGETVHLRDGIKLMHGEKMTIKDLLVKLHCLSLPDDDKTEGDDAVWALEMLNVLQEHIAGRSLLHWMAILHKNEVGVARSLDNVPYSLINITLKFLDGCGRSGEEKLKNKVKDLLSIRENFLLTTTGKNMLHILALASDALDPANFLLALDIALIVEPSGKMLGKLDEYDFLALNYLIEQSPKKFMEAWEKISKLDSIAKTQLLFSGRSTLLSLIEYHLADSFTEVWTTFWSSVKDDLEKKQVLSLLIINIPFKVLDKLFAVPQFFTEAMKLLDGEQWIYILRKEFKEKGESVISAVESTLLTKIKDSKKVSDDSTHNQLLDTLFGQIQTYIKTTRDCNNDAAHFVKECMQYLAHIPTDGTCGSDKIKAKMGEIYDGREGRHWAVTDNVKALTYSFLASAEIKARKTTRHASEDIFLAVLQSYSSPKMQVRMVGSNSSTPLGGRRGEEYDSELFHDDDDDLSRQQKNSRSIFRMPWGRDDGKAS